MTHAASHIRVLHLEDSPVDAELIREKILSGGLQCEFNRVNSRDTLEAALTRGEYDIVLLDYNLPGYDGLSALKLVREMKPDVPVMMISGSLGEDEAVKSLQLGAKDYLLKQRLHRLQSAVVRALDEAAGRRERKLAELKLKESEERFRQLAENSSEGFWFLALHPARMLYVSPALEKLWGIPSERFYASARAWESPLHPDDAARVRAAWNDAVLGTTARFEMEYRIVRPDGSVIWVAVNGTPIRDASGAIVRMGGTAGDVTERRRAEEQVHASLREKEVLLKEIHHRVKNNMQVISSLLHLQASAVIDARDKELFVESQNRVRSMALIHEYLYQSPDLAQVNFGEYVGQLLSSLRMAYKEFAGNVAFTHATDVTLPVDTAIPCGLIINELVTNALKHAFPADARGEIRVAMSRSPAAEWELRVQDNGIGMPSGRSAETKSTLGIELVTTLVHQLGGTLAVDVNGGTTFTIRFRD